MNILSLFDGISCGQLALKRAGIKIDNYYASEIEPDSIKVAQHNFPNTIQIGDVRNVKGSDFNSYIDLLIGGSPCQNFSIAGKMKGAITKTNIKIKSLEQYFDLKEKGFQFKGQSYLFWEYVRLLREIKPQFFLLENVKMKKEWEDIITKELGVSPIMIDSAYFSAQERPRLYWTNWEIPTPIKTNPQVIKDILEDGVDESYFYSYPLEEIDLSKQVCAKMIFKNYEMNKRIFNPDFKCHTLTACKGGNIQKKVYINGRARKMTPLEYERLQTLPDNYTACVCKTSRYNTIGNGWNVNTLSYIFSFLPNEYK